MWCARSGGPGPSAEAAVTRDRRDRERLAGRLRGGAVSVRWAVGADVCGVVGCRESERLVRLEVGGERRVLCLPHARGWLK